MFGSIAGAIGGLGLTLYNNHQEMSHADFWNRQNVALQKEFAQNSIKWRVEDAKRAGVHPMAALGIQASSFSPVSSSLNLSDPGGYLADLGQNIDRAVMAGKDKDAQQDAKNIADAVNGLTLEKMGLENDLLRAEIASKTAVRKTAATPPAPKVNTSTPSLFDEQPDTPSPSAGSGVDSFDADPASMFTAVVVGDSLVPVFHPDIADPLSESIHSSTTAKLAYLKAVNNGEILGPPRSTWSKSQKERVDSGRYHWVFDGLEWKWYLRKNAISSNSREVRGKFAPFEYWKKYR